MFMSTRYKKRHETVVLKRGRTIFNKEDSLAKLCEFLNNESSVTKLITPKYKDFRSQKLKFDQKTRLNNAIWRAWHIQYKRKKKARFLQFAAPFSDESAHTLPNAVLLEGKYWKRRLDAVSGEFKKWRRIHKEKLLKTSGPNREEINKELSEEDHWSSESEDESERTEKPEKPSSSSTKQVGGTRKDNTLQHVTLSAMYDFHDTLFSSLEKNQRAQLEAQLDLNHSEFKDFSGMVQPTLDHLNPSFDLLLENFDYYSEYYSQPDVPQVADSELLLDGSNSYDDSFMQSHQQHHQQQQQQLQGKGEAMSNISNNTDDSYNKSVDGNYSGNQFQELPPQLQAPHLTAHIKEAMSTRHKPLPRNRSDPCLVQQDKLTTVQAAKRESSSIVASSSKRPRRNTSHEKLQQQATQPQFSGGGGKNHHDPEKQMPQDSLPNAPPGEMNAVHHEKHHQHQHVQYTVTPILPKSKATVSVPILPKYTQAYVPYLAHQIPGKSHQALILGGTELPTASTEITTTYRTAIPAVTTSVGDHSSSHGGGMPYVIIADNSHSSTTIATQMPVSLMQANLVHHSGRQHVHESAFNATHQQQHHQQQHHQQQNVIVSPVPQRLLQQQLNHLLDNDHLVSNHLQGASTVLAALPQPGNNVNEQHLITLAQLLQNAPTQGTEQTLNYLELLQQQLSLMLKHQQESIQLKQQIQQQTEKMLSQQQQQEQQTAQHSVGGEKTLQQHAADFTHVKNFAAGSSLSHEPSSQQRQSQANSIFALPAANHGERELPHHHSYPELRSESIRKIPSLRNSLDNTHPLSMKHDSTSIPDSHHHHRHGDNEHTKEDEGISFAVKKQSSITVISKTPMTPTRIKVQPSVPPTTLDSAIALVALRHGAMSPETSEDLSRTHTSEGNKIIDPSAAQGKPYTMEAESEASTSAEGKNIRHVQDRRVYNEHRRQCHLSAEQRRRGLIKNAFEDLGVILYENGLGPSAGGGRGAKLSNAAILQHTCEHIKRLQDERVTGEQRLSQIQQEIEDIRLNINECQKRLPTSGSTEGVHQSSDAVEKGFFEYCKEMIKYNRTSWLFCAIMRPLFDSFNKAVTTKTRDEFVDSVTSWFQSYCTLPNMRLIILETLTKLSTSTSALDDPGCIAALADSALQLDDPTDIGATAKNVVNTGPQSSANSDSSSPVWSYPPRFGKKNI